MAKSVIKLNDSTGRSIIIGPFENRIDAELFAIQWGDGGDPTGEDLEYEIDMIFSPEEYAN